MPRAPPISRVASLTADATPCFWSGAAVMIADVVGAVHNPNPVLITISGQHTSRYEESVVSVRMHRKPIATSTMLTKTTVRKPSLGRYQADDADSVSSGKAMGLNASAAMSAE